MDLGSHAREFGGGQGMQNSIGLELASKLPAGNGSCCRTSWQTTFTRVPTPAPPGCGKEPAAALAGSLGPLP